VRHLSLPLMNSFNKTEGTIFPCWLCFLRAFLFLSLICANWKIKHFDYYISVHSLSAKLYQYCLSWVTHFLVIWHWYGIHPVTLCNQYRNYVFVKKGTNAHTKNSRDKLTRYTSKVIRVIKTMYLTKVHAYWHHDMERGTGSIPPWNT